MQTCWHMRVGWCVRFMPVPVSVHLCMHVCMLACTHALINSWACTPLNTRNNPQVPHGVWTHIAASYDRVGGSRLFVNGSLVDYRAARGSGNAGADGGVDSHIDNTFPNRFRVGAYLDDRGGGGGIVGLFAEQQCRERESDRGALIVQTTCIFYLCHVLVVQGTHCLRKSAFQIRL